MADVLDTTGMWDATASLPEQVFDASVAARGLEGLPDRERIENVVVLGMGGSGIAGDLLVAPEPLHVDQGAAGVRDPAPVPDRRAAELRHRRGLPASPREHLSDSDTAAGPAAAVRGERL